MLPKTPLSLKITYLPIEKIRANPLNPRQHTPTQIKKLAASINKLGFNAPLLVDKANQLISGHCRLDACRLLKLPSVPTICLSHLSSEEIKAFMVADNRLAELATWDEKALSHIFESLSSLSLDFDVTLTGFDMGEIDVTLQNVEKEEEILETFAIKQGQAVTQQQDIWQLDKHRVLCGNSLEEAAYTQLMQDKKATLILQDPPYNQKINGHVRQHTGAGFAEFRMASGEMKAADFTQFLHQNFLQVAKHSTSGSLHIHAMDFHHAKNLLQAAEGIYTALKNICVWVKPIGGMGSLWRSQHELFFVFKNGKAPHINNVALGKNGRYRTNVWQYPSSRFMKTDEDNACAVHPTVKPVQLMSDAILDCSKRNQIVLDTFLGSGSTLIAASRVGRICYGIEIEPLYVDATILRWQKETGQQAIHVATGQTFFERRAHIISNTINKVGSTS